MIKKGYNHPGLGKHNELKYKIQSCTRFLSVSIWCWFRFLMLFAQDLSGTDFRQATIIPRMGTDEKTHPTHLS